MKIKLTQPGYENFTGAIANVDFVDGVSSHDISPNEVTGLAATISVAWVDEDESPVVVAPVASQVDVPAADTDTAEQV